jgi:hypothetical protein
MTTILSLKYKYQASITIKYIILKNGLWWKFWIRSYLRCLCRNNSATKLEFTVNIIIIINNTLTLTLIITDWFFVSRLIFKSFKFQILNSREQILLGNSFFYLSNMWTFRLLNRKPFTCTKISLLSNAKINIISSILICIWLDNIASFLWVFCHSHQLFHYPTKTTSFLHIKLFKYLTFNNTFNDLAIIPTFEI